MRVHGRYCQIALFANFVYVGDIFMPDTKTRRRSPHIGALAVPRSHAGIDTHGKRSPGEQVAISSQLIQGTRIKDHALLDQVFQIFWYLLCRKHDVGTRYTGPHGALGLVSTARVDVQALLR